MPGANRIETSSLGYKDRRPELTQFRMFKSGPCTPAWGQLLTLAPHQRALISRSLGPAVNTTLSDTSQPEHKQHGLVSHVAKLGGQRDSSLGYPAQPGHDRDVLLAAGLEGHRRSIDARPDIDFPQRLKARIVVGDAPAVAQSREQNAPRRRQARREVSVGRPPPRLGPPPERVGR